MVDEVQMLVERIRLEDVLARYVRGVDRRDGAAVARLFFDDALVQVCKNDGGSWSVHGEPILGAAAVAFTIENVMPAHPTGGWSHHCTFDHLIEIDGSEATLNAQFIATRSAAEPTPADGWPAETLGARGSVIIAETGYYDADLRKVDGEWRFAQLRVRNDLPWHRPTSPRGE